MNTLQIPRFTLPAPHHPIPGALRAPANGNRSAGAALRERLRAAIQAIERAGARRAGSRGEVVPLGLPAIEAVLPGGGLTRGALHEVLGNLGDDGAAEGFAALLLARLAVEGPVLWCLGTRDLYGPGLAALGLSPGRLVLARGNSDREILWAMEEGLRSPGFAAVLGEPRRLDLIGSRRLQLAAEASGITGLVLRRASLLGSTIGPRGADGVGTSVAMTRWRIASLPGTGAMPFDPCWQVELLRCRGAAPLQDGGHGTWRVDIDQSEIDQSEIGQSEIDQSETGQGEKGDATRAVALAQPLAYGSGEAQSAPRPVRPIGRAVQAD